MSDREGQPAPGGTGLRWVIVVVALAVVTLVGGIVYASAAAPRASNQIEPGINQPTRKLLQLDVLSGSAIPAPDWTLTDQHGDRVSLSQFRGKSVVLTFNDDRCEDLCTLLAQDVLRADKDLGPASKNVVFLSVNANPYYPRPADVKQWSRRHGLGRTSNWVYATGSPARLKNVWHSYGVPVQLDPKTKSVVHGTEIFFIDPSGSEVALAQFGTAAANTSLFAHGMAQMAVDTLPSAQRTPVKGPSATSAASGGAELNQSAPAFTLPSLSAKAAVSSSSLRGEYTVVNFWSSTCTACVRELPDIEKSYQNAHGTVNVIGVDVADTRDAGRSFAGKAGVTYPLVLDADGRVAGDYRVPGLPFTAIVGPHGKLVVRHPGIITSEQLDYILQTLSAG